MLGLWEVPIVLQLEVMRSPEGIWQAEQASVLSRKFIEEFKGGNADPLRLLRAGFRLHLAQKVRKTPLK
jgi:hypothetical protein